MSLSRRHFLQISAIAALGSVAKSSYALFDTPSEIIPKFVTHLPTIPKQTLLNQAATLPLSVKQHRFTPALPFSTTEVFALGNMSYQGPTIEAKRGQALAITIKNLIGYHVLGEDIDTAISGASATDRTAPRVSIHLHGGLTPSQFDGHPEDSFHPGEQKTYHYKNQQEAAMLWYHDHALGITRINNWSGAQGLYIIRDEFDTGDASNTLGLPYGEYEIPMIVQDRAYKNWSELRYMPTVQAGTWTPGMFGNLSIVNGIAWPKKQVKRAVYRVRLLNGSNTRYYKLHLSNGMPFYVIGNDQGLLNAPVSTTVIEIAPGERYDCLLDFRNVRAYSRVNLINTDIPPFAGGLLYGNVREVMQFQVSNTYDGRFSIPSQLRKNNQTRYPAVISSHQVHPIAATRNIVLSQATIVDLFSRFLINNLGFHAPEDLLMKVPNGRYEQWNIINANLDAHSMHIHLVRFRIIERVPYNTVQYLLTNHKPPAGQLWNPPAEAYINGAVEAPHEYESGWKDTVLCPAGKITRLLVEVPSHQQLGFNADETFTNKYGKTLRGYMIHCHMLGHEDNDMMQSFRIIHSSNKADKLAT